MRFRESPFKIYQLLIGERSARASRRYSILLLPSLKDNVWKEVRQRLLTSGVHTGKTGFQSIEVLFSPEYFKSISRMFPYHGKHVHTMEMDKFIEIGFSNLFLTIFSTYFHTMEEVQSFQCHSVISCRFIFNHFVVINLGSKEKVSTVVRHSTTSGHLNQ